MTGVGVSARNISDAVLPPVSRRVWDVCPACGDPIGATDTICTLKRCQAEQARHVKRLREVRNR